MTNKETGSKIQRSPAVEETSRTVMSDGTVIKIMPDGSTQVLKIIFSQLSTQYQLKKFRCCVWMDQFTVIKELLVFLMKD